MGGVHSGVCEIAVGWPHDACGARCSGVRAADGKQALLGMKIWEELINKKGGLPGRQVKLVYYDDQTNPSTVPGVHTKLLDADKVDLVVGPYLKKNTIKTIMGDIKFGANGEWAESGMMQAQYHGIKGNDLEQFRGMESQTVVRPSKLATGKAAYPFEKLRQ